MFDDQKFVASLAVDSQTIEDILQEEEKRIESIKNAVSQCILDHAYKENVQG